VLRVIVVSAGDLLHIRVASSDCRQPVVVILLMVLLWEQVS
jgi:hypothetical protein